MIVSFSSLYKGNRKKRRDYLFICGCPRSGTTALWKILSAHGKIALGCERFNKLYINSKIKKELFNKDRFFTIQKDDTFYSTIEEMRHEPEIIYNFLELPKYYNDCKYFGDKFPNLYIYYELIKSEFPDCKIIFLMRNIFDVANSYEIRANDEKDTTWTKSRNVAMAIRDWNESLTMTNLYLDQLDFYLIPYEKFYYEGKGLTNLFAFLNLDIQDSVTSTYKKIMEQALEKEKIRENNCVLTSTDKLNISLKAKFNLFRSLSNSLSKIE